MSDPIFGERVATALAALHDERDALRVVEGLRAALPDDLARRAAELHRLRRKARNKFPAHPPPYLSSKGYEQASAEAVADHRAARIAAVDRTAWVADLTCGIGADSLALARGGQKGVACDTDAYHLACAGANLRAAGAAAHLVRGDALRPATRADFALLDPDRRVGGERSLDPERASPPFSEALGVASRHAGACLKLAPALDPERLRLEPLQAAACGLEWVSLRGELAELALWTGALCPAGAMRRATRLDGRGGHSSFAGEPEQVAALDPRAIPEWIADPDPALVRSGLLGALARSEDLAPLDPRIGYLGGDRPPTSPLLAAYRVLDAAALDPRRVKRMLAAHEIGPLQVLKRGHPDPAEVLARRLQGAGPRRGTLIVARIDRGHRAFLVERLVGDEGFEPPTSSL